MQEHCIWNKSRLKRSSTKQPSLSQPLRLLPGTGDRPATSNHLHSPLLFSYFERAGITWHHLKSAPVPPTRKKRKLESSIFPRAGRENTWAPFAIGTLPFPCRYRAACTIFGLAAAVSPIVSDSGRGVLSARGMAEQQAAVLWIQCGREMGA